MQIESRTCQACLSNYAEMQLCLCKGNKFFWNDQMFGGFFCPINCKLQIANCKLVFLYVSVCITLKGCLRIVILLIYKVIIYYYNNIINNIIYILYIILLIPSENNKENIEFAICNLQFAIFLGWIIGYRAVIMMSFFCWAVTLLFVVYR